MKAEILEQEMLARYTSWKIGGPARYFADAQSLEQLVELLGWARERGMPVFLLGGGTNLLVSDSGFDGLVLRYRDADLRLEERGDEATVTIAAGAPTAGTVRKITRQGYAGLEWAEGLPGTIGGALYGNAGCYGGDVASTLTRAWLLVDGKVEEWPVAALGYGYRTSGLKRAALERAASPSPGLGPIVLSAEFALRRADPLDLVRRMAETAEVRRGKTPQGQSCGSVFKNPPEDSAGRLLEAAGLKGTRVGGAEIAEKHANYIVNRGGATSADVLRLAELARERVLREFGVALELEVQMLG